jgi:outer membrane receptor protein involved in Fe transport
LVDGIRLNNSTFRLGPNQYVNTIDPYGLDQIEIVRGPASSLYGSDGLGGVINSLSADASPVEGGAVTFGYDTAANAPLGSAVMTGGGERVAFSARLSAVNFGDLEGGGDTGVQSPTGYQRRSGGAKISLDLDDRGTFTVAGQLFDAQEVPRFDRIDAGRDRIHLFDPQRRALGYVRYERDSQSPGAPSIVGTVSRVVQTEGRDVTTDGLGVQLTWPEHNRQEWLLGIEYYRDDVHSGRMVTDLSSGDQTEQPGRFPDGARYRTLAAYTQASVQAGRRTDVIVGARYSRFYTEAFIEPLSLDYSTRFDDLTGSVYFLHRFTPHLHLTGGIGRGFRAPGLDDLTVFGYFNAGVEVPSPNLRPETVVNYELSLKALYPKTWLSFTYFDSQLENLIARAPGTFLGSPVFQGEDVYQRQNVDGARINGVELDFNTWLRNRLMLSFTLTKIRGTNELTGDPLRRIPPLFGRFGMRSLMPWRGAWGELTVDFADRQDRLSPGDVSDSRIPEGGTPGYGVVSIGVGVGRPDQWQASLQLHNLGDVDYRVHGSGINGPGRSVRLMVSREFGRSAP